MKMHLMFWSSWDARGLNGFSRWNPYDAEQKRERLDFVKNNLEPK